MIHAPYVASETEPKAVLWDQSLRRKAYVVHPEFFPKDGIQLAALLNAAFERGRENSKAEIRSALGIPPL